MSGTGFKVLLVDDEQNALIVYSGLLREWGFDVLTAEGTLEAMEIMRADSGGISVAIVDLKMPPPDGMTFFRWVRANYPDVPVIILTAYGSIGSAVDAISEGAFHYLAKPPEPEQFRSIIEKAASYVSMSLEIRALKERLEEFISTDEEIIGRSLSFKRSLDLARAVSGSDAPVLILGETGTGKEMMAKLIHNKSRRAGGPFVSLNCGALPPTLLESELFGHEKGAFTGALSSRKGRFEEADGGTIFLDEIGDCAPELQVKLLRVLEEKEFCRLGSNRRQRSDFRLLAATNRNLGRGVKEGSFRQDLYFRINVFEINLPPLKERMEDLSALAWHFLKKSALCEGRSVEGFSPEVLERLMSYEWPGNIRELENVIQRAVILSDGPNIKVEHLPFHLRGTSGGGSEELALMSTGPSGQTLSEWERRIIKITLARCGNNKSRTARMLGISRKVLYSKMQRHGIC